MTNEKEITLLNLRNASADIRRLREHLPAMPPKDAARAERTIANLEGQKVRLNSQLGGRPA